MAESTFLFNANSVVEYYSTEEFFLFTCGWAHSAVSRAKAASFSTFRELKKLSGSAKWCTFHIAILVKQVTKSSNSRLVVSMILFGSVPFSWGNDCFNFNIYINILILYI